MGTNKAIIKSFYDDAPTAVNSVVLVGHVAIPYSGSSSSDNHSDHFGAWVADSYYADTVDAQLWTDSVVDIQNTTFPQNSNCPSDGRFDNNGIPSQLEMGLGRVDFAKLPTFQLAGESISDTEVRLLNQYFAKNHKYRNKVSPFPLTDQVVCDLNSHPDFNNRSIFDVALRVASRSFGNDPDFIVKGDIFAVQPSSFLWGMLSGSGEKNPVSGDVDRLVRFYDSQGAPVYQTTQDFANYAIEPKIGFYVLHGSYLADWNSTDNNLLKAALATPNYGLAVYSSSSSAGTDWYLEPLALGEILGAAVQHSVKTAFSSPAHRWMSLLGDPTLRLQTTAPPSNPTWDGGNSTLSWVSSPEDVSQQDDVEYLVEWSTTGLNGPWTKLTVTQQTSVQHTYSGTRTYRIRTQNLLQTGSGSFYNLSQGISLVVN